MNLRPIILTIAICSLGLLIISCAPAPEKGVLAKGTSTPIDVEQTPALPSESNTAQGSAADEIMDLPIRISIDGQELRFLTIAVDAFEVDDAIEPSHRQVSNYKISARFAAERVYILFQAKPGKDGRQSHGGVTSLGRDVMYVINRENYSLVGRNFFK